MSKSKKNKKSKDEVAQVEVPPVQKILNELTPEQERFIVRLASEGVDIMKITREVFNNNSLNGRTAEGKAVRAILLKNGIDDYRQTIYVPQNGEIELTEEDKNLIMRTYKSERSALTMAKMLWPDRNIVQAQKEVLVIQEFVRSVDKKGFSVNYNHDTYNPPLGFKNTLRLVNVQSNLDLEDDKLSSSQKRGIEKLMLYLKSPRYLMMIRQYVVEAERDLFEAEFVRCTWDKPDLTQDELNLFINLCQEYINQFRINETQNRLQNQLNSIVDNNDDSKKIQLSLVEALKDQADQHHKQQDRQRKLSEQLNGLRKDRIDKKTGGNKSLASLIEAFQEEENRKEFARLTQIYEKELTEEVKRLGGLEDFQARIFGVQESDF